MSEQVEQKTTESRSVADMSSEEIQAEIERVDKELAQEPASPLREPKGSRPPSANSGETLARKANAARQKLLESAEDLERSSIPFPGGQSLRTNNVELLSLTQGERARIVER